MITGPQSGNLEENVPVTSCADQNVERHDSSPIRPDKFVFQYHPPRPKRYRRNHQSRDTKVKLVFIAKDSDSVNTMWGKATLHYVKIRGYDGDLEAPQGTYTLVQGWKL